MVNLYGEVRLLDMSVMAYITRIKKTFLTDVMRYSNFTKIIIKILTNVMKKYLKKAVSDWDKKKVLILTVSKQWFDMIVADEKTEEYRVIKGFWMSRLLLIKDEECKDSDKFKKLHIGKNEEIIIDTDIIKKKLNNGTMKFVPFTHVLFKNGYYDDSPKVEKEIESISIGKPKKGMCPDKWIDTEFFIIKFKYL